MFGWVLLVGLMVTGSPRQAVRYFRDWGRSILILMAAGAVIALVVWPFIPSP